MRYYLEEIDFSDQNKGTAFRDNENVSLDSGPSGIKGTLFLLWEE